MLLSPLLFFLLAPFFHGAAALESPWKPVGDPRLEPFGAPFDANTNKGNSNVDCDFNAKSEFCGWKPVSLDSADLWRIGNAVIVDSVNSITKSPDEDDNFAYVQGEYGAPSVGSIESPEISPTSQKRELKFSVWKVSSGPVLDICVKELHSHEPDCMDSVSGEGETRWMRRSVRIPVMAVPFRLVFRARNVHSAEDIIGIDNIQLLDTLSVHQITTHQKILPKSQVTNRAASERLFSASENEKVPLTAAESSKLEAGSGSSGFLMPLKMNKFGMAQSRGSPIVPVGDGTSVPNFTAPNFPDFPSFNQGLDTAPPVMLLEPPTNPESPMSKIQRAVNVCKAVKCSFLDNTCSWTLGPNWNRNDGNIAMELAGEDFVTSALFKVPLGAFVEFDLWMSDDSFFSISQLGDGIDSPIFTRQGMANNGWHRFRVPLRPTFLPASLKLKNTLPPGGFVTLSNTRLVDGGGEEIACETVEGMYPGMLPPSMGAAPRQQPSGGPKPVLDGIRFSEVPNRASMGSNPSTSFGGNIFEGLRPIEPLREDVLHLTAFQGYDPRKPQSSIMVREKPTPKPAVIAPEARAVQTMFPGPRQLPAISSVPKTSSTADNKDLLSQIGASPEIEQQLRSLARQFGFSTNTVPDEATMTLLKRFVAGSSLQNIALPKGRPQTPSIEGMHPIRPINANINQETASKGFDMDSLKRIVPALSSPSLNADLIQQVSSVISLPPTKIDTQDPLVRKHLDFAYQNALSAGRRQKRRRR